MNNQISSNTGWEKTLTNITTNLIIPCSIILLIFSLFCGWKANCVLTGQILTRKTLYIITDSITLMKFNFFGYLQFRLFFIAIILIGICFFIKLLISLFRKDQFSKKFWFMIFVVVILGIFGGKDFYSNIKEYKERVKNEKSMIAKKGIKSDQIKALSQEDKKSTDTLLKEMICAARDIVKLLMNWTILLLTGLGYIVMRMMKLIE